MDDVAGEAQRNDALYNLQLASYIAFRKSLNLPLTCISTHTNGDGFSRSCIDTLVENHMGCGGAPKTFKNLTSLAGGAYRIISNGSTGLRDDQISEFLMRLALTFQKSRDEGKQFIAPLSLNNECSSVFGTKQKSAVLPPFIDLDETVTVSPETVKACISDDGFIVKERLEKLHYNTEQLAHKAAICCQALCMTLGLESEDLFCSVLKSRVPAVTFVREESDPEKADGYGFKFAPLENANGDVDVKMSSWLFFGLRRALETPVDVFAKPTSVNITHVVASYNDEDATMTKQDKAARYCDQVNFARIMRRDSSKSADGEEVAEKQNYARGWGITMSKDFRNTFYDNVRKLLTKDSLNKKSRLSWTVAGTLVKFDGKAVDAGASASRPPGCSKTAKCAHHRIYTRDSDGKQTIKSTVHAGGCVSKGSNRDDRRTVCSVNKKSPPSGFDYEKDDPTNFTSSIVPSGVHFKPMSGDIDERDKWLITSRTSGVVLIVDGNGKKLEWANNFLKHATFGSLFEAALVCIPPSAEVVRFSIKSEHYNAPGVSAHKGIICTPYHRHEPDTNYVESLQSISPDYKDLLSILQRDKHGLREAKIIVPWHPALPVRCPALKTGRVALTATSSMENFLDGNEPLHMKIKQHLLECIKKNKMFNYICAETKDPKKFEGDIKLFVVEGSTLNTNNTRPRLTAVIALLGHPFFCPRYFESQDSKDLRINSCHDPRSYSIKKCPATLFRETSEHATSKGKSNCAIIQYDTARGNFTIGRSCCVCKDFTLRTENRFECSLLRQLFTSHDPNATFKTTASDGPAPKKAKIDEFREMIASKPKKTCHRL